MSARDWNTDYVCDDCGAHGVKLWREYSTFIEHQALRCAPCAAKSESVDIVGINDDGMYPTANRFSWAAVDDFTDQIGWLVPAVPTDDGDTMWGYTSVPAERVAWWRALPSVP